MFKEIDYALLLQKIQDARGSKASLKQICIKNGNFAKELANTQSYLKINYPAISRFWGALAGKLLNSFCQAPLATPISTASQQ